MSQDGFIAYIDEAGDTGVKKVLPLTKNGASEWLIIAATVIDARREHEVRTWKREFVELCAGPQAKNFHFRKSNEQQQIAACIRSSTYPVRHFVVCSNKKNMQGYKNPFAQKTNPFLAGKLPTRSNWLYYWVTRLLLERVTDYVARKSISVYGEVKPVRLEFSERGAIRYDEMSGYLSYLKQQDLSGSTYLKQGSINWSVLDPENMMVFPHEERDGLILPDVVASAFYQAVEKHSRGKRVSPVAAMKLAPRMAKPNVSGVPKAFRYGVKIMPSEKYVVLDDDQKQIFRYYGYNVR